VRDDLHGLAGDEEDTPPGETFLQRLHRRKHEARLRDSGDGTMQREPTALTATEQTPPEPTDADMPPLESLTVDSDYSGFMSAKVSEALRRAALRKLFHSPKFNVCDGLDDYCDDFTRFAPLGSTVTADMRHQLERAARQALAAVEESAATTTAAVQPDPSRYGPTVAAADPPPDDQPPDEKRADDADADPA